MNELFLDFETRSRCDIKRRGASVYARDPSTVPLCLAYRLPGETETRLWVAGEPFPVELQCVTDPATELHAHNAAFERSIWQHVMGPRYGWPAVKERQWHCTAARCAAMALPRSLDGAGKALGLAIQKDKRGKSLIQKLCKPQTPKKPTKKNPNPVYVEWNDDPGLLGELYDYCKRDVDAEIAVHEATKPLHPRERVVWLLDQRINERGIPFDRETVESAVAIEQKHAQALTAELRELTGGAVQTAKQTEKFVNWFAANGCNIGDITAPTVAAALAQPTLTCPTVRRALEIRQQLGKACTAKYTAMLDRADDDDRIRGTHLYCGAGRTGRFASLGVQFQNIVRAGFEPRDIAAAVDAVRSRCPELLEMLYGSVAGTLAKLIRPSILAPAGSRFLINDFSGIEARVLAWLAGEARKLKVFQDFDAGKGPDAYCVAASNIYGKPVTKADKDLRQMGKIAELGLGYQMWATTFIASAASYGIALDAATAEMVIRAWRQAHPLIVRFWYALNDAAIAAVTQGGEHRVRGVTFCCEGRFLVLTLPSGRRLYYCDPLVCDTRTPWGELRPQLSYMGEDRQTRQWVRISTYGGMLAENVTQAVSRDFLIEAALRLEIDGYPIAFHVHDELVALLAYGVGSIHEMSALMTALPPWGKGCPIAAEGFESERYRK